MKPCILFFDIDGTILSHRTFTISDSTRNAIRQARANGHLTFINTGRTGGGMGKDILDVGFDGCIYGCGTRIIYRDKELLHVTIPNNLLSEIIDDLRHYHIEAMFEGTNAIYYMDTYTNELAQQFQYDHLVRNNCHVETVESPDISVDKFCIFPTSIEGFQAFCDKYQNVLDFIDRGEGFFEVIPKGYSKASGIEFLINYLNIPHENTFAIGDSSNDLPMLEYVKHSIAMGNASKVVLDMASFVTKDVDEDGIAFALKHFHII